MGRPVAIYGAASLPKKARVVSLPVKVEGEKGSPAAFMGTVKMRRSKRLETPRPSSSFVISERAINKACDEVRAFRKRDCFIAAQPVHFVALFMLDFYGIYKKRFEILVTSEKFRRLAVIAVRKLMQEQFADDAEAFHQYYDWCIKKELKLIDWSRSTGHTFTPMHWRAIFSADKKYLQWSLELRRTGRPHPINIEKNESVEG